MLSEKVLGSDMLYMHAYMSEYYVRLTNNATTVLWL